MITAAPNDHNKKSCDGHSVAVIITDPDRGVLIGDTLDGAGASSVGGHVFDDHLSYYAAACKETEEEVRLKGTAPTPVFDTPVWRGNPCKRGDGRYGVGHYWRVYIAKVKGQATEDPNSFRNLRWVSSVELQRLAQRTLDRARDNLSADAWNKEPGITPTWVRWFVAAGLIEMTKADLQKIEVFMRIDGERRR